jgi:hypothetical protein
MWWWARSAEGHTGGLVGYQLNTNKTRHARRIGL